MVDVPRRNVRKLAGRREARSRRVCLERNEECRARVFRPLVYDVDARSRSIGSHRRPAAGDAGRRRRAAWTEAASWRARAEAAAGAEVISGASAVAKTVGVPMIHRDRVCGDRYGFHRRQSRKRPHIRHSARTSAGARPKRRARRRATSITARERRSDEEWRNEESKRYGKYPLQRHNELPHNRSYGGQIIVRTPVSLRREVAPIGLQPEAPAG
jgi:hypothetical protein